MTWLTLPAGKNFLNVTVTHNYSRTVLLSCKDGEDRTALHFAAHGGKPKVVNWILDVLKTGDDALKTALNKQDSKGWSGFARIVISNYDLVFIHKNWQLSE